MKKRFICLLLAAMLTFGLVGAFTGCGSDTEENGTGQHELTVSFNGDGTNIVCYDATYPQTVTDRAVIEVYFNNGYMPDGIVAKVNGSAVTGSVMYTDNTPLGDVVDYDKGIEWRYEITGIKSNVNVEIDVSACKKGKVNIAVAAELAAVAKYAIVKDSVEYLTSISPEYLSTSGFVNIQNNTISVPYGGTALLLLPTTYDHIEKSGNSGPAWIYPATQNGSAYLYRNGSAQCYVYPMSKVEGGCTITLPAPSGSAVSGLVYEGPNLFTFVMPNTTIVRGVAMYRLTGNGTGQAVATYENVDLYDFSGSISGYKNMSYNYMYIGDRDSFNDEPGKDDLNDTSGIANAAIFDKNEFYVGVRIAEPVPADKVTFYLAKEADLAERVAIPAEKIVPTQGDCNYTHVIKLTKADVQEYIEEKSFFAAGTANTGHCVLFSKLDPTWLAQNAVRVNIDATMGDGVSFDISTVYNNLTRLVEDTENDSVYNAYFDYMEYTPDGGAYYFDKSALFPDNGNRWLALNNTVKTSNVDNPSLFPTDMRYTGIRCYLNDNTDPVETSYPYPADEEYLKIPVRPSDVTDGSLSLRIEFIPAPYDSSAHTLTFAPQFHAMLYVCDDPTKPFAEWTRIEAGLDTVTISYDAPLYCLYFTDGGQANNKPIVLEDSSSQLSLSEYGIWYDLVQNSRYISVDGLGSANVYVLYLKQCYLQNGCGLYVDAYQE